MTGRIAVGQVFDAHGVRGAVRVWPLTDDPNRLKRLGRIFLCMEDGSVRKEATVAAVSIGPKFVRMVFKEVTDRTEALRLKGATLEIPESEAVELPEGRWFQHQLIGLEAVTLQGEALGRVVDILETGANDVYVVSGEREWMVPAIEQAVREIDLEAGRMTVDRDWIVD